MARTKAGGASKGGSKSRRGSNAEDKKNIENGLYVHSSPPTVVDSQGGTSGSAHIREYLRRGNIAGLEEVVLEGYGNKLLTQSSTDTRVRAFLKTLPSFISKIELVHDAAERGDLRDLKSLLDRRKIARSKDSQGMGILHKAVLSGNTEMVDYLMKNYPETATVVDHDARTPLHYCAASKNPDEVYSLLSTTYDNPQARDSKGKTASNYMSRPSDLKVERRARYAANKKRTTPNKRTLKTPTPPKREGLNINGANIRIWIHDQDLPKLERIVWEGQGLKLLKETSNNPKVRQFLNLVPRMMIKIKECHQAVINNDMELLEAKADQPELLSAKDQNGLNCLHKAAALGHPEMCEWIIQRNQSSLYTADKLGRTPLFYATLPNDEEETFSTLVRGGADTKHLDRFKKKAEMYKGRSDLDLSVVYEPPIAPRSGTGLDMTFSGGTSLAPSRMTSRAPSRAPSRNVKGSRSLNPSRRNSLTDGTNGEKPIRRSKSTGRVNRARRKQEAAEDEHDDSEKMGTDSFVFEDMSDMAPDELDKLILEGDLNKLENIVLSGKGNELRGKSSWNEDVRKFLKKVPGYMENVNGLHDAADAGNLKNVKRITEKNPRLVYGRGRDGSIALHHMARSGNLAGVKHLYSLYPDGIHVLDQEGKTPVHWTAQSKKPGAKETYAFLQKMGAPTDLPDDSGQSAEDYINHLAPDGDDQNKSAKSSQKNSPANSRNGSRRNSLNPPSNNGSRRGSQSNSRKNSLKKKSPSQSREPSPNRSKPSSRRGSKNPSPSPSARSNNKSPTPSNASRRGSDRRGRGGAVSAADAAMEKEVEGAINDADKGEYEGINDIIMRGDGRLLVGRGSKDEDTQQFLDKIPSLLENIDEIHSAAEEGDKRRVANLIDKRKKASVKDSNHSNILHKSVLNGHTDLSRYLIMTYPELLHHQDRAGRTPLHYAAVVKDGGHLYKILNKAGADPTITDRDGYSPEAYIEDRGLMTEADLKEELREGIPLDGSSSRRERKESPTRLHTKDSDASYYGDEEEGMERADSRTMNLIERTYKDFKGKKSGSLLKKHLTPEIFQKIKHRVTSNGGSLLDVIKSGVANPDSSIGVYAPDSESYTLFHELFDPIISDYHEVQGPNIYHPEMDLQNGQSLGNFDDFGDYVISTRIRCARNLEGYPFNPLLTKDQYLEVEQDISRALDILDDDLAGFYKPLSSLSEKEIQNLIDTHLLFKQGDRFLEAANACRFWPYGRGIYLNSDATLCVWVNEEDHMRIISMQKGGDLGEVYDRFVRAVETLGEYLSFSSNHKLGFLTFCPTNLGTAIRASVHIKLPHLLKDPQMLEETADKFNLQVRGTKGEHSDAEGGVFDISNRRRLGITESEAIMEMYSGVLEIIAMEKKLAESKKYKSRRRKN